MHIIDEENIPWKDCKYSREILDSKQKFLSLPDSEVYPKYLGIRKYIKQTIEIKFEEKPDYEALEQLLLKIDGHNEEELAEKAIEKIVLVVLAELVD